ncbi:alpha-L-fucosidase [Paenibacillus sp. FSL H7-0714]|uniref:alpha-L-fucosidase n=1 Tax=Paenibacillus sp. FSL H7-0714 TaxID=2954735 RepID=UPI0030F71B11
MANIDWFNEARFGMFVHWGAYSGAGRGEWVLNRENIPLEEYTEKYANHFLAERYDPREWVQLAKKAGMKYIVLTTKHHDGFCLWDTKTTDFNTVNIGPKRDLVRPFAEAVREAGLKLGFYFSVMDWSHPDYPDPYLLPEWHDEEARRRFVHFYQSQLEELLTQYGKVDMLWYDGVHPKPMDGERINTWVQSLQPHILINNRNGEPCHFGTPEQEIKAAERGQAWESCITLNDNWGYHAGDYNYKSSTDVIRMLTQVAEGAGNLLLNIGPKADGTVPDESIAILSEVGQWLERNGEFLYASSRSPFEWNNFGRLTTKGNRVYVHIFHSTGDELCISEIGNPVLSARVLSTGQPIPFDQYRTRLFLKQLPAKNNREVLTLVLDVEGPPQSTRM